MAEKLDCLLPLPLLPLTMEALDREFTVHRLWQVDDKAPFRARPVRLPQPDGSTSDTAVLETMSGEGGTLSLNETAKARGIGDCWVTRDWTWTGAQLALVSGQESPCKLFEAGGLSIGLWRTR